MIQLDLFFQRKSPQPPGCVFDQVSLTKFWKCLFFNQQSRTLKGLGPQSVILDLSRMGQWSEKSLFRLNCVLSGHLDVHSSETKNLSSILFAASFGLIHVYFLLTHDTSSTAKSDTHSLNFVMLLRSPSLWDELTLSDGCLMLLKSPKIHHKPSDWRFFSCLIESHSARLPTTSHGAYTFMMNNFCMSWFHTPSSKIKPLLVTLLSTLNTFSFQIQSNPPAVFVAGCVSQLKSVSPHKAWHTPRLSALALSPEFTRYQPGILLPVF